MKTVKLIVIMLVVSILSISTVSCGDDEPLAPVDPPETPVDVQSIIDDNGLILVASFFRSTKVPFSKTYMIDLKAHVIVSQSLARNNLVVEKIVYYINGEQIASSSTPPFDINFSDEGWTIGSYNLTAIATINGKEYQLKNVEILTINDPSDRDNRCDIVYECTPSTTGGTMQFTALLNEGRSSAGMRIRSMTLLWDGQEVKTITKAPFVIDRRTVEKIGTTHSVMALLTLTNDNGDLFTEQYINTRYIIRGTDETVASYMLNSKYPDYKLGESIHGMGRFWDFRIPQGKEKLEVFLDNELIANSSSFPFDHEYKLQGLSLGKHKVSTVWTSLDSNGNVIVSIPGEEIFINIVE